MTASAIIVSVMYPASGGGGTFDHDYYLAKHMPLVQARWGGMGLRGAEVLRGAPGPDGAAPTYDVVTLLRFESMDAFKAAAKAHAKEIFADIPRFTPVQPVVQFNEAAGAG